MPANHPARARVLGNLAHSLLETFRNKGDVNALNETVSASVGRRTCDHPEPKTMIARCKIWLRRSRPDLIKTPTLRLYQKPRICNVRLCTIAHQGTGDDFGLGASDIQSRISFMAGDFLILQVCPIGNPARARWLSGMSRCFLNLRSPLFSLSVGVS
jgi:hypothetical protein